jgi:RNA polymerase sigma factor (sigma-70 family)
MLFKRSHISLDKIIEGCIRNDRKYQGLLYDTYFDTMFKLCRKYANDESDALIMLNNGFLKVFLNVKNFQHQGSFEGWLRKIMYRSVADFFRNKKENISFLENIDDTKHFEEPSESLENLFIEDIVKHIEALPTMPSKVLMLFAVEGFTHKEIGQVLQISENTSKWYVTQAREILKQKLGFNQAVIGKYKS